MAVTYKLFQIPDAGVGADQPSSLVQLEALVQQSGRYNRTTGRRVRRLTQIEVMDIGPYICVVFAEDERAQVTQSGAPHLTSSAILTWLRDAVPLPSPSPPIQPQSGASPRTGRGIEFDPDPFDPAVAERHFQALGRRKGPLAAPKVQDAAKSFWPVAGRAGAVWLAGRLRVETNVETLHAAGSQLADMGEVALEPILLELDRRPAVDQAIALLKALGWMIEATPTLSRTDDKTEATLGRLLQSREADIREAAAQALMLIPLDRAAEWLESRLADERDQDVAVTIREVLDRLRIEV